MCYKSSGHFANLVPPERVNDTVSQDASCRGTHNASGTQDTSLTHRSNTSVTQGALVAYIERVSDTGHVSDTQKASVTQDMSATHRKRQ